MSGNTWAPVDAERTALAKCRCLESELERMHPELEKWRQAVGVVSLSCDSERGLLDDAAYGRLRGSDAQAWSFVAICMSVSMRITNRGSVSGKIMEAAVSVRMRERMIIARALGDCEERAPDAETCSQMPERCGNSPEHLKHAKDKSKHVDSGVAADSEANWMRIESILNSSKLQELEAGVCSCA